MELVLGLIDSFTNGYCLNLARALHIKTNLPICAIYDESERLYTWGRNYFQYFVKVDDDKYLDARGIHTEEEIIKYWVKMWNDSHGIDTFRIVERNISSSDILTHYEDIDEELELMGCGITITPLTYHYADFLIASFL